MRRIQNSAKAIEASSGKNLTKDPDRKEKDRVKKVMIAVERESKTMLDHLKNYYDDDSDLTPRHGSNKSSARHDGNNSNLGEKSRSSREKPEKTKEKSDRSTDLREKSKESKEKPKHSKEKLKYLQKTTQEYYKNMEKSEKIKKIGISIEISDSTKEKLKNMAMEKLNDPEKQSLPKVRGSFEELPEPVNDITSKKSSRKSLKMEKAGGIQTIDEMNNEMLSDNFEQKEIPIKNEQKSLSKEEKLDKLEEKIKKIPENFNLKSFDIAKYISALLLDLNELREQLKQDQVISQSDELKVFEVPKVNLDESTGKNYNDLYLQLRRSRRRKFEKASEIE